MVTTEQGSCHVCSSPATQKCAGCQSVFYCSRDHQKQHWKRHKLACTPARVKQGEGVGRYLEATRDIKSGEVVMKEKPIVVGPAQVTPPVCLGCYKLLEEGNTVDCAKCGWPFCSEACTASEAHEPECFYTQQRGDKVKITVFGTTNPNYQCITTLRCMYQRDHNPMVWEKLQTLQSHCEERKVTEKWAHDKKVVVDFILKFFKLEGKFTEQEIMKCCGILQINGHEVPLTEPEHLAVYNRVSMIEHHCRANCNKSFTSDGEIIVSAAVDIPANAHLSVCYTDALIGTDARRHHLAQAWLFECSCTRCCDVTEAGTMYSALKCKNKDCKDYLLPETFIKPILVKSDQEQKPEPEKPWKCNTCKDAAVSDEIIQKMLHDIGNEIANMPKGDPDACERFIAHCSAYLHPSHYYMSDVTMALAQMIGQGGEPGGEGGLAAVTQERLLLKTQLCRKCADLLETLAPAELRPRGSILFELHAAVAETGRRQGLTEGPATLLGYMHESRKILKEAALLLRHEPPELPEGKIYQQAKINLIHMDQLIDQLSAALPSPL